MDNIIFGGGLPVWLTGGIAVLALVLLVQQFLFLKQRLTPGKSLFLTLLRACVYVVLLFFLLGPASITEETTPLRRPLVVLTDTSQSMALPTGEGEKTRLDVAKEILASSGLREELAATHDLKFYQFGKGSEPLATAEIQETKARGPATQLFKALAEVSEQEADAAGIIVLSDGIVNTDATPKEGVTKPVFAIALGQSAGFKDLRIKNLRAPKLAFRGREIKIDFTIEAYGLSGTTIPLYFNLGRNLISTHPITIDGDAFEEQLTLNYTPRDIGAHAFSLTIPIQAGEKIRQNNTNEFRMDVRRDKIRVLTLSGSPSWNYRFLRLALKQDPFIDLVSFVFLRTPDDVVDVPENELSLIPFPIDEIFLEELKNFDVLILDDFSHRSYFNALYLESVRDFVRDGGGIAMLGGTRAFDGGGYWDSPLSKVLPVTLNGKGEFETNVTVRASLTPAGKAHPITRILAEPTANEEAWSTLPALTTLNEIAQRKGEVLLLGATGGRKSPLLSIGKFSKGRTMAFMSDDLWRWNFDAVGRKQNPQVHLKLVRHSVRWLAQEPSFDQVQIIAIAGSRRPGDKLDIRVRVLKDDYAPAENPELQVTVTGPEGERFPLETLVTDEPGDYRATFTPTHEGSYRIEAAATMTGTNLGKSNAHFLVSLPSGENEDGRPRDELLRTIAQQSKGLFASHEELNADHWTDFHAKMEQLAPSTIVARSRVALWNSPLVFALVVLFLGTEWWLRRTWGLV